jgi:adenylate cyclase class IV
MIEIEKKFKLTAEQLARLLQGATSMSTKRFSDTYFDTSDKRLTTHDIWLRTRDGVFELKVPIRAGKSREKTDVYRELTTDQEILSALALPQKGSLGESLKAAGIEPFCTIVTERKKYKRGEFSIDVDRADFGYQVTEIELEAPSEAAIQETEQKILDFAKELGFSTGPLNGKVCEWIMRNTADHYEALVRAGVFGDYKWQPKG